MRCGLRWWCVRWCCGVLLMVAAPVGAQDRPAVLITVETGATEADARAWRQRVERAIGETSTLEGWVRRRQPAATVDPDALAVIERIQALLVEAKAAAARLRERDALTTLGQAEALAETHLEVPGMAAWYAEVQLAIAVTSAQAGAQGLSEAALRRAASVDPSRGVQAAEARPEVVERGRAAVRAAVTAPRGRFEVRANAPGATAALDDRPLGTLPLVVSASIGPHVLRVDAPGQRGWARVVTVFEGERPPVSVALSPTPLTLAARALEAAARSGDADAVAAGLRAIEENAGDAPRIWMLWPGAGPRERAVLVGCDPTGCGAVRRLEDEPLPDRLAVGAPDDDLRFALRWSSAADEVALPAETPWWERWYVWVGAGAVIAAAVTAAIVAAMPQGPGPRRVEVGWGDGW